MGINRIEQIKIEIDLIEKEIEEAEKSWDFSKVDPEDFINVWKEYCESMKPYNKKYNSLNRELRTIIDYKLEDLPTYGDVMSLEHFIENVKCGGFIDYDGFGNYVKDGKMSNIEIYPSDVKYNMIRKDFDTIIWFNR